MGMYFVLFTLSDENIENIRADPALVWKVLAADDSEVYENARSEQTQSQQPVGFFKKIFGWQQAPVTPAKELDLAEDEVAELDLDKSWHALHYLLTGTAWEGEEPLDFIVKGGIEVGEDTGYGPARALTSAQVQALNTALQPIDEELLRSRFNPAEMMRLEIYPSIWDRDPAEEDSLGYVLSAFDELKTFVAEAAEDDLGLLIHIT